MLIDTHAHLDFCLKNNSLQSLIEKSRENDVVNIIAIGDGIISGEKVVEWTQEYEEIFGSIGIHPHDSKNFNDKVLDKISHLCQHKKIVALGEIGLDYYRQYSPPDKQKEALIKQLELAISFHLPIIIHSRQAHEDIMEILKKFDTKFQGVFHCFSGDLQMAIDLIKMGFYISVAGPLTYRKNKNYRLTIKKIPDEKIVIETDAPFLPPEPFRGKPCEPWMVKFTALKLAEVKKEPFEKIAEITSKNAKDLFKL